MGITANINTDATGNIIVHITGSLDYENNAPLRQELLELSKQNTTSTITLDLFNLDFVGSSGIGIFVETLRVVNDQTGLRLINVKTEFIKVFKLYHFPQLASLLVDYEDEDRPLEKAA
jgi:anti-sigma B factor antagonist